MKIPHISDKICLTVLLILASFVFFISSSNLTCSNDGSHFALVSAIAEKGRVEIHDFLGYTHMIDYCVKDGEYFSDRPPGLALISLPFYAAGKLLREIKFARFLTARDNISEVFVMFLPNISGVIVVLLTFLFCLYFGLGRATGFLAAGICAFATPVWIEASRFFSHALSMMLVFSAAYIAISIKKTGPVSLITVLRVSVLLALASIVEIQNILFIVVFSIYFLTSKIITPRDLRDTKTVRNLVSGILVFFAVYGILIFYNYTAFERLTIKSNLYNPLFPEERGLFTSLSGNIISGLDRLFTNFMNGWEAFDWSAGIRNRTPGIFVLAPVFLVSAAGFFYFFKERKEEAVFFACIILCAAIVAAAHKTVLTRHISTVIPFLFFPAAFIIRNALLILHRGRSAIKRSWLLSSVILLACVSSARVFYVINTFWGRSLSAPFPFIGELGSFVFFYGILAAFFVLSQKISHA